MINSENERSQEKYGWIKYFINKGLLSLCIHHRKEKKKRYCIVPCLWMVTWKANNCVGLIMKKITIVITFFSLSIFIYSLMPSKLLKWWNYLPSCAAIMVAKWE